MIAMLPYAIVFGLLAGLPTLLLVLLPDLLREKPAAARARIYREEVAEQRKQHLAACYRIRPLLRPGTPDAPFDANDPDYHQDIMERVAERLAALGI